MKYIMLIYSDETAWTQIPPEKLPAVLAKWMDYGKSMAEAGILQGADQLQPVAAATKVRLQAGKVVMTDGPFAETKDQLGGYYLLDVPDLDTALEWAGKCPALLGGGTVEVRPLVEQRPSR